MPSLFSFLRENARWLAAGFLMALASSFGQTFFIAIFSEPLRQSFSLSEGEFASIYMVATLGSAFTLIWLGQLADTVPPRRLAALIALALAGVCLAMASVTHWLVLIPVIFGLRLFGQGMISHLSQTTMARWFVATRGRALAVASFGYPTGEALAPLAAVALIAAVGWRQTWVIAMKKVCPKLDASAIRNPAASQRAF
ncbi:MAG: MFS transporter, partial [Pseudomonadota bacterium]